MDLIEIIIKCAAGLAAITAIVAFLYKWISKFVKFVIELKNAMVHVATNIDKVQGIDDIKRHCHENYLTNLRLTIMSSEMPLGERIVAAEKYISEGGNGDVKKFCINELHVKDIVKE